MRLADGSELSLVFRPSEDDPNVFEGYDAATVQPVTISGAIASMSVDVLDAGQEARLAVYPRL